MEAPPETIARRAARAAAVSGAALLLAIVMTWPLAAGFTSLGKVRSDDADGMYAIWNVSWVARTLTEAPLDLFEANIFYPHRRTLAFSEINLVAGIIGVPGWLATKNALAAHNSALLFAFATSALGAWLLARRLSGSGVAAIPAAIAYGCCPYFFAHSSHIQLLMGGGVPLSLLMLHRLVDRPTPGRGAALGGVIALQALACAYYGILAGLMVGYAALFFAVSRRLWREPRYWMALGAGALISAAIVLPFFIPFMDILEGGFTRTLDDSRRYSANLAGYLASPAHAHRWLLDVSARFGRWGEVLFPGFLALGAGLAGFVLATMRPRPNVSGVRDRENAALYGSLGLLVIWASFGPKAGLYTALYEAVPLFSFLRAPSRFGIVAPLILGGFGATALARLAARPRTIVSLALAGVTMLELNVLPFPWSRSPRFPSPYRMLAQLPRGPLAEFPFYGERVAFHLHSQYMYFSTSHWQPMLNGYSDHIPADFRQAATVLDSFPSNDAFAVLRRYRTRYIGIHWNMFGPRQDEIRARLVPFAAHLRELASDDLMTLYEIVSFP